MSDLETKFEQAVHDSKALPERPDNLTMLKIYAFYKQASEGDAAGERPALSNFVERAKWDAWQQCCGQSTEVAMQHYIDLIESLK